MFRSAGLVLAGFAVWMIAACSGNAEGGEETGRGNAQGSGGSASTSAGAGGTSATSGTGGSSSSSAGAGGSSTGGSSTGGQSGARYTAREACELFAAASCDKGLECGLVLTQVLGQLICVQCNDAALSIIVDRCLADGTTDKEKAAVDGCISSINAQLCAEACVDPNADGCAVFGELDLGNNAVVCDDRCAE
ncbi:MAG: hypothetical protein RL033_5201 [Pseudomonadota bacterium]|jgi:hypothetical protein